MTVNQINVLLNAVTSEILGQSEVVLEDLANLTDVGTEIFNAGVVDNYVKALVNRIGKTLFVNRKYSGNVPSVLMDSWEFGSVLQKVSMTMPEAEENDSWKLTNGTSYDQDVFYQPTIEAKFFNKKVTFEIPMSFTTKQIKESFNSADEMNGFLSMVENGINNSMTVKTDSLIMRTINSMIGETLDSLKGANGDLSKLSGTNAVNLLKLYNEKFTATLTPEKAMFTPDFIKFATYTMGIYADRIKKISTLFNIGKKERFTPAEAFRMVVLSDFKSLVTSYLQADSFNKELNALPICETVPYWQGSGTNYELADTSKINVKVTSKRTVEQGYILGIIFDKDCIGVTNLDKRVTTNYNAKGEFYNNYYKFDAGYFCDLNENFVVFFLA